MSTITRIIRAPYGTTGLDLTIDIFELPSETKVIDAAVVSEIDGEGLYYYSFTAYDTTKDYSYIFTDGTDKWFSDNFDKFLDASVASRATLGTGATEKVYTLTDSISSAPLEAVSVEIRSANDASLTPIAQGTTDDAGEVTFYLDTDTTYYIWHKLAGYTFTNPTTKSLTGAAWTGTGVAILSSSANVTPDEVRYAGGFSSIEATDDILNSAIYILVGDAWLDQILIDNSYATLAELTTANARYGVLARAAEAYYVASLFMKRRADPETKADPVSQKPLDAGMKIKTSTDLYNNAIA